MKARVSAIRTNRQAKRKRSKTRVRRARRPAIRLRKRRGIATNAGSASDVSGGAEYDRGYRRGLSDGAEKLLETYLPTDRILPDVTAEEAMAAGVQALGSRAVPLLGTESVWETVEAALREKRPFSFIRLGDGELMTLAQEVVLPVAEVREACPFLPYAGVVAPDFAARDEVAQAVRAASLVGVPVSRKPHFQPLLFRVLRAHRIACADLRLTTSTMNYALHEQGFLQRLLAGRKLLLVGNVANELSHALRAQGYHVAGIVCPVRGFGDADRAVREAAACDFDLALVSAGIAAIPIVVRLAGSTGKVAIDFGHLADKIAGIKTKISARSSEEEGEMAWRRSEARRGDA